MSGIIYGYLEGKELDEMARIATTIVQKKLCPKEFVSGYRKVLRKLSNL